MFHPIFGQPSDDRLTPVPNNKVVICTPYMKAPPQVYVDSMKATSDALKEAGYEGGCVLEVGNAYISYARMILLRNAMDHAPKCIVFIDYDLEWDAASFMRLIETEGDVVAGNYRYKQPVEEYMGSLISGPVGEDRIQRPIQRPDGCVMALCAPAGFLKITPNAVNSFMKAYPERIVQPLWRPSIDMFHQGAKDGTFWGEDFAFSRDWRNMGQTLWIQPNLNISHHEWTTEEQRAAGEGETRGHPGNFRDYLFRQPGGSADPVRIRAVA